MKTCPKCGAQLDDSALFCNVCGESLANDAPPVVEAQPVAAPVAQLQTNRSLAKYILLSLITFGIYGIVCMSKVSSDINIIASRYDGKKTTHFCLMSFVLAPITLSIYMFVWYHGLSARIGTELARRGIDYKFGSSDFWLWEVLGSLIVVGPFIYVYKLLKAMNLLAEDFNTKG